MKGGRKNLKRAAAVEDDAIPIQQGQSIMQVVSLRGSNLIEHLSVQRRVKQLPISSVIVGERTAVVGGKNRRSTQQERIVPKHAVMDAKGDKVLAFFPAKFQKSLWIKRGSFVVVDESGKDKALESGSKVACIVSQVLYYEQVRALQKSTEWPEIFRTTVADDPNGHLPRPMSQSEESNSNSSDEDGLPPLEANTNRIRPHELQSDSDSDS